MKDKRQGDEINKNKEKKKIRRRDKKEKERKRYHKITDSFKI